jgi:hypothetical protein
MESAGERDVNFFTLVWFSDDHPETQAIWENAMAV